MKYIQMNTSPFYSIVIPLYNKEKYIKKTLESVLNQTFNDFEIIIIDDGSTDKSCEIVKSIKDHRIHLIHQENGGPSKARNHGIKEANGQYIAFLDADDEWFPKKLEKQYKLFSQNIDLVWSCTGFKAAGGKRIEWINYFEEGVLNDALDAITNQMSIQTSTVVIKKSVFNDSRLLFNESVRRSEDREVWLKMACLFPKMGYIKNVLSIYRVNAVGSLSASGLDELDFPFLSLPERMENVLSSIDIDRKEKVLDYFNDYAVRKILSIWGWSNSFFTVKGQFENHVSHKLLSRLEYWNFLPKIIKKILVKLYSAISKNL